MSEKSAIDSIIKKKPRIVVVNEHDTVIGYKDRDSLSPGDIYRVTSLWLTNEKREVLLAQRSFLKKKDPGKWSCAVAGTVDEGEEYDDNIVKETAEEIGVTLALNDLKKGPKMRLQGSHNDFFDQWYMGTIKSDQPLHKQDEEVEALRWIHPDELSRLLISQPDYFVPSAGQWLPELLAAK